MELSPSSVEFAYFYANVLYEAAIATDGKGYEEVVQECERALSIEDPVDPAKESLQEETQQKLSTPEERIAHVHQELRSLIQKANLASITTWVKVLGNGNGEEKFRLIPLRRGLEDPMGVSLVPARRPNEIKTVTKTMEERRKEIEVRVAAARLLQQKSNSPPQPQNDERDIPAEPSSGVHRLVVRRKQATLRKISSSIERMGQVRGYWKLMSIERKLSLLGVSVNDLRAHYATAKDGVALKVLSEALSFAESNKTWKVWVCCRCSEKFTNRESHIQHVVGEHLGNLSPQLQAVLPQEVDSEWVEMLLSGCWKPIDVYAAVRMLEDGSNCESPIENVEEHFSNNLCLKDTEEVQVVDGEFKAVEACNWCTTESRDGNIILNLGLMDNNSENWVKEKRWPLSDDSERAKLLEKIHSMFQLLLRHKCLAASHLNKVIQYAMDELQGLALGLQLVDLRLDLTPVCFCFLQASQLQKVFEFLQELLHYCGLNQYSEKDASMDDSYSATPGNEILEMISLNGDSSCLILDEQLLKGTIFSSEADDADMGHGMTTSACNDCEDGGPVGDAFLSWIFAGPSSGEQLPSWIHLREEKTRKGMEILQMLEKKFYHLQSLCKMKCKLMSYEEALNAVESLCLEELKRRESRDHDLKFVSQSYEYVLRKRQKELAERDKDVNYVNRRFELDAISNVIKEAQDLNASEFGNNETLSGVAPCLRDLDCGDDEDWKIQEYLLLVDTCIEVAIQRHKEQTALEVCFFKFHIIIILIIISSTLVLFEALSHLPGVGVVNSVNFL